MISNRFKRVETDLTCDNSVSLRDLLNFLKRLLGRGRETRSQEAFRNSSRGEYDYLLEIRPILEKYKLKSLIRELRSYPGLKLHRVPHITLVYNFTPKVEDYRIIRTVADISKSYDSEQFQFFYDGIEIRRGGRGYVIALRIIPSEGLRSFRDEVYRALKPVIVERPDVEKYNENLWFHAALSFRSNKNPEEVVPRDLLTKLDDFLFKGTAMRITLLRKGKIRYEYDTLTGKILNRSEALSKEELRATYSEYRKRMLRLSLSRVELDNIWLTADHHFGHENIIKYSARPFANVTEMDEFLKERWNELVSPNDKVFILGDFARSNPRHYLEKLKGKKILIQGNHDPPGIGPESLEISYGKVKFVLSHYPLNVAEWNVHGHVHNNKLKEYPFLNRKTRKINVGVDLTKFYPVNLRWIIDLVESGKSYLFMP